MRISRASALLVPGVAITLAVTPAQAAPPAQTGNCVSYFTSTLAQAGAAGEVISFGARDLAPFGRNAVRLQAAAPIASCPFDPDDFLP